MAPAQSGSPESKLYRDAFSRYGGQGHKPATDRLYSSLGSELVPAVLAGLGLVSQ
jgi:hypothetical protein